MLAEILSMRFNSPSLIHDICGFLCKQRPTQLFYNRQDTAYKNLNNFWTVQPDFQGFN